MSRKGSVEKTLRKNGVKLVPPTPRAGRWVRVHATHESAEERLLAISLLAEYCLVRGMEPVFYYEHDPELETDHTVFYVLVNTNLIHRLRTEASHLSQRMKPFHLAVEEGKRGHPIVPPQSLIELKGG